MDDSRIKGRADAEGRIVAAYCRLAAEAVDIGVSRAHAHATVALTDTLIRTPAGRATLRRASRSRSYVAALSDLDAIAATLAGPSVASLDGTIRDAREALYREALKDWVAMAPEGMGIGSHEPTKARIADVRGLVLHGMEVRREVASRVDAAKRGLLAALEMAARPGVTAEAATDRLRAWESSSREAITRAATVAIGDSAVAIDGIAAIDAARPEYRPEGHHNPE